MKVNSYLSELASNLILSEKEHESIKKSIDTLEIRLHNWFKSEIKESFKFGSYTRNTILPRKFDEDSDIDYMVVFNNGYNYTAQTYLNKLKKFAETYYSTSEIYQSTPTIVLELNHIKFELVPAFKSYECYYISDGKGGWMMTFPNYFNNKLTKANNNNEYKIKPLVRLMKLWNVNLNYKFFSSYEIEEKIAYQMEHRSLFYNNNYVGYVIWAFNLLKNLTYDSSVINRINRDLSRINKAIEYENNGQVAMALTEIKKVFCEE